MTELSLYFKGELIQYRTNIAHYPVPSWVSEQIRRWEKTYGKMFKSTEVWIEITRDGKKEIIHPNRPAPDTQP